MLPISTFTTAPVYKTQENHSAGGKIKNINLHASILPFLGHSYDKAQFANSFLKLFMSDFFNLPVSM